MAANSCCLVSLPSLTSSSSGGAATTTNWNKTSISLAYLPLPSKSAKLKLSSSHSYSCSSPFVNTLLSLKKKRASQFSCLVSILDIKQEEEGGEEEEEEEDEEEEFQGGFEFGGNEQSEGEYDGEDDTEVDGEEEEEYQDPPEVAEVFVGNLHYDVDSETPEEYQDPPEDAKLFVGNLPYDVDSETLAQLFEQAGVVEIAEVIYNRETDRSRGFGFVTMSTVEEAERAVGKFDRYDLNGRFLTVNKASPRGARPQQRPPRAYEPSFRIYVGNLPWDVDDARLEQVFSEHGKVESARVVYDRDSGRSRGFGFVIMASESEMNDAIANLDGQSLDGRAIRVNMAEERPRRNAF